MEKRAQRRIYALNPESTFEIERWAAGITEMWNSRLDRLDKALKNEEGSAARGKSH